MTKPYDTILTIDFETYWDKARQTIAMMRSIASKKPITPFHLMAADQMEQLLEEALKYRKEKQGAK